jgi:hypothetical protein
MGFLKYAKEGREGNATVGSDGVVVSVVIPATIGTGLRRISIGALVVIFET